MTRQTKLRVGGTAGMLSLVALIAVISIWKLGTAQSPVPAEQESAPPPEPTFYDPPDAYDLAAIQADPKAYYSRVVPSRVWQLAPVPPEQERHEEIMIEGEAFRFVEMDAKLEEPLIVRAKPGRPVTFTALDHGRFPNGKRSMTIPADENGYAQVDFWTEGGGGFRVLAGSPENQGPAEFVIQAMTAKELSELKSGEYARQYWANFKQSPHAEAILSEMKSHNAGKEEVETTTTEAKP